jgi:hypothetical protein
MRVQAYINHSEWCDSARRILNRVMAKNDKTDGAPSVAVTLLAALKAESARLALEIPALVERKRQVDALIASDKTTQSTPPRKESAPRPRAPRKGREQIIDDGPFAGLSLQEAARKHLADINKPLSGREIWPALKEAGFKTASSRPEGAIHWALRKRQKKQKDVMLVEGGKWALTAWYTPEQRAEINRALNGMAGRDRENHSAKTKRGMKLAEKRGVRIGAKKRIDDAMIKRLQSYIAAGESIRAACAKENISVASFFLLRKEKKIPGLEPLTGTARRRARMRAEAKKKNVSADLLTPSTEGSVH